MLTHNCRRCGFVTRIFRNYVDHLWGVSHQKASRSTFLNWDEDENLRSLVVYAPGKTAPPTPSDVINLFLNESVLVVDFVFWISTPRLFIVQLLSSGDVERILQMVRQQTGNLTIGGEYVGLRRKCDVLQNEWPILVGAGVEEECVSKDPVLIELSDDTEEEREAGSTSEQSKVSFGSTATGNQASDKGTVGKSRTNGVQLSASTIVKDENAEPVLTNGSERMEVEENPPIPVLELEPSRNGNDNVAQDSDSNTTSSQDESISEETIKTKMSDKFVKTFLSKVKQESVDDKRKVNENLRWMEKKWTEIYLGFHNKIWPVCFVMENSSVKIKNIEKIGFEAKFKCECLRSESNRWLRKKLHNSEERDAMIKSKVEEFRKILDNETECNRRLKQITECSRFEKPLLNFTGHIIVTFNNTNNTTAEFTLKNIEGKQLLRKVKIVKAIFNEMFKEYEKAKIKKWSAAEPESTLDNCEGWTKLVTIE